MLSIIHVGFPPLIRRGTQYSQPPVITECLLDNVAVTMKQTTPATLHTCELHALID